MLENLIQVLPIENAQILLTILVILLAILSLKLINVLFKRIEIKTKEIHNSDLVDIVPFLDNVSKIVLLLIFGLISLNIWGIDISPILASAGVAGLAVAFAAKESIANLFGGLSILMDKPYRVGDLIDIENQRGEVIQIGARSTKIKTRDNVLITVPNSAMVTSAVINETGLDPKLRIRVPVDVSYDSDLDQVEKVVLETMKNNKHILADPEPLVRYREFADSGITLEALATVANPLQKAIAIHSLIKDIHSKFKEENIEIPYPQRDVHIKGPTTRGIL